MKKIEIKTILTTSNDKNEYNVLCAYNEESNRYIYYEPTKEKTKVILDLKNNELIRENENLYMKYSFNIDENTDNILKIKDLNKEFNIIIKTKSINIDKNIKIEYYIEDELYIYEIIK